MLKKVRVEVLTTQMGVTSGGLDSEDTTLDVEEGDIEGTTTKIVDEDVALLVGLTSTETVGDGGSGRLVDDTEDVEARDGTGVLGGLTLVVVEVGRDSDDGLLNLLAELGLSNLLHLLVEIQVRQGSPFNVFGISRLNLTLRRTMEEISWAEKDFFSPR